MNFKLISYGHICVSRIVVSVFLSLLLTSNTIAAKSQLATSFSTQTLTGQPYDFNPNALDKPYLLVFWATWCLECRYEFHELKILHAKYDTLIEILGISIDQNPKAALTMQQEAELPYLSVADSQASIAQQYNIKGTPTLILVSHTGAILSTGHRVDEALKQEISTLVNK